MKSKYDGPEEMLSRFHVSEHDYELVGGRISMHIAISWEASWNMQKFDFRSRAHFGAHSLLPSDEEFYSSHFITLHRVNWTHRSSCRSVFSKKTQTGWRVMIFTCTEIRDLSPPVAKNPIPLSFSNPEESFPHFVI